MAGKRSVNCEENLVHSRIKAQMKQAQANNTTHNINNSPTVNINVTNGSVENVKKAVKQAVGYPSARNFNGLNGMS